MLPLCHPMAQVDVFAVDDERAVAFSMECPLVNPRVIAPRLYPFEHE